MKFSNLRNLATLSTLLIPLVAGAAAATTPVAPITGDRCTLVVESTYAPKVGGIYAYEDIAEPALVSDFIVTRDRDVANLIVNVYAQSNSNCLFCARSQPPDSLRLIVKGRSNNVIYYSDTVEHRTDAKAAKVLLVGFKKWALSGNGLHCPN